MKKLIFLFLVLAGCTAAEIQTPDPEEFRDPGSQYAIHTWWHWMDNAITREGITADLEAMKEEGIATATILNVSLHGERDLGVEPVFFDTPEWYEMFRWALEEAHRLGITIGVHNCDGWSTSGGPWVTPEQSMKICVWNKSRVSGPGKVALKLPEPSGNQDFYRDIAVLAYPSPQDGDPFAAASPDISVNGSPARDALYDGNPFSMIPVNGPATINIAFPGSASVSRLAIHGRKDFSWGSLQAIRYGITLQADEGSGFRTIASFDSPGINQTGILTFPETTGKRFRVLIGNPEGAGWFEPFGLAELELLPGDGSPAYATEIPHHLEKTVTTKADPLAGILEAGDPDVPSVDPTLVTDLSSRLGEDGVLEWEVPEGDWTLLRIGYTTTGVTNGPATNAGRGLECDKMDTVALNAHFGAFPARLAETAGEFTGNTFEYLFVDSWECLYQNWTGGFPDEFASRRGYDILPWLPVIAGEVVGSMEETERFLQDFRSTIADLIEHNYYQHFHTLCERMGLRSDAEVIYGGAGYPPLEILGTNRHVDVPMFEFWAGLDAEDSKIHYDPVERPGSDLPMQAAALYRKQVVPAEAYTGYANYSETPWDLKLFGDRAFCSGVNQMVLHSYVHQPAEGRPGITLGIFGQTFNRYNPWWAYASQWFDYHRRVQYMLQQGTVQADVLCFTGDRYYDTWSSELEQALPPYFRMQKCNADVLSRAVVKDGRIVLDNGISYGLLFLPGDRGMELETLQLIEALVKAGAIVSGPRPQFTLSLKDAEARDSELREIAARLWGTDDGPGKQVHVHGKGRVYSGHKAGEVIEAEKLVADFSTGEDAAPPLLHIHKKTEGAGIWFLVNQEDREVTRTCRFTAAGGAPQVWDPLYGEVYRVEAVETSGDITQVSLTFPPKAALFVLTGLTENKALAVFGAPSDSYTVSGFTGSISFDGLPDRAPVDISDFSSYTESGDEEIKYYSGQSSITLHFELPDSVAKREQLFLSLGKVSDGYSVSLNDRLLGEAVFPDYRFDASGIALAGPNTLEVRVGNVYRNSIIGELTREGELKSLWTTSPIGNYLDEEKPLAEAGIMGPLRFLW